ncbi:hypothetical protein LLE49_18910 [Alicyclobacillus tolerans]|uniref:hypothetical protein n=1 Tax=Alicyclobacillus tolerans TaxID=90970 RepID=UPI001F23AE6A|nr:hypothetical protein [Alicyclobacillus tolerans]MCF8566795.1 hypothetical protein [Alicyclobacillus tolerans]
MELSRCCGAPIVVEVRSDLPNFTDDDYDLKVPFRVCSKCGAVLIESKVEGGEGKNATAKGDGVQPAG